MEMEHINENTIRILIKNEDLINRGITFLDLLSNHKEVESFFYSILEEIDVKHEFRKSEAVTFQVLPKNDGLELFISKNNKKNNNISILDYYLNKKKSINNKNRKIQNINIKENNKKNEKKFFLIQDLIILLENFENLIQLVNEIKFNNIFKNKKIYSNLYKLNNKYYLRLIFDMKIDSNFLLEKIAKILEFSVISNISFDILEEYGKLLIRSNALILIEKYFKY